MKEKGLGIENLEKSGFRRLLNIFGRLRLSPISSPISLKIGGSAFKIFIHADSWLRKLLTPLVVTSSTREAKNYSDPDNAGDQLFIPDELLFTTWNGRKDMIV